MLKLKQRIRDWLNSDQDVKYTRETLVCESESLDRDKSINFTLWVANGGKIIQTSRYDRVKDRRLTNLYVISHNDDIGIEISKIISLEGLRA